jgi:hypothetical protein
MFDLRSIETTIRGVLADAGVSASGLRFHSREEWIARGERYGHRSLLILSYEGAEAGEAFEYDYQNYPLIQRMADALAPLGVYSESATRWYSTVGPISGSSGYTCDCATCHEFD